MSKVLIDRVENYDIGKLKEVLSAQFSELKIQEQIKKDMLVVIKPNLVIKSSPESGVITHPNMAAAVALLVKEMGANVLIAESSGGVFTPASVKSVMTGCGYQKISEDYDLNIYTKCETAELENPNGQLVKKFTLVKPFVEADFIINIGKLKSHCMTRFTGAVKNLFGTVPGLMKPEFHFRFPKEEEFCTMLTDLCETVKPNLSIIDAVDGMEGDGPSGGIKRHIGLVLSSLDPYSLDFVAASVAEMEPMDVLYLKNARERELFKPEKIEVIGEELKNVIQKGFKQPRSKSLDFARKLPKPLRPIARKLAETKPIIPKSKCIGCGKCSESCPKDTIRIEDKIAIIDYSGCIKCFCCHEMCPKHIIKIKRFSIFNL